MAKLTVAEIRKQISALEAKAVRLAEEESRVSVQKVRALMNELGVTLEHLSSALSRKTSAVKKAIVGKELATGKRTSKGAAKYQDPKTGATWSGFGRAPGWIAGATNRDAFLVGRSMRIASEAVATPLVAKKKAAAKKASAKKLVKPAAKKLSAQRKKATAKASAGVARKKPSFKETKLNTAAKKVAKGRGASNGLEVHSAGAEGGAHSAA